MSCAIDLVFIKENLSLLILETTVITGLLGSSTLNAIANLFN
jgi:hypothetical protein